MKKFFTYLGSLLTVMILFSGCKLQVSYNFSQSQQNISEIALCYVDGNDINNVTVFENLPYAENAQFIEDFLEIACYRRSSNPSEPGSAVGLAIRFTYADGMYEVVTAKHIDVYSHAGNVLYRRPSEDLYFDEEAFDVLVRTYFQMHPRV